LYDLRQDFVTGWNAKLVGWKYHGYALGPIRSVIMIFLMHRRHLQWSYTVQLKNVGTDDVWLKSAGTIGGVTHTIEVYVRLVNLSPWSHAIFAGQELQACQSTVCRYPRVRTYFRNRAERGDYAIDLGGTAQLVGNNYAGINAASSLKCLLSDSNL